MDRQSRGRVGVGSDAPRSLTLVTCYPFYFVGSAPQRFIVRAVRVDDPVVPDSVRDPEEQ